MSSDWFTEKWKLLLKHQVRFVCSCSIFTMRRGCCTVTWSRVMLSSRATLRASRSATLACLCSWTRTWKVTIQESRWRLLVHHFGDIGSVDSIKRGIGGQMGSPTNPVQFGLASSENSVRPQCQIQRRSTSEQSRGNLKRLWRRRGERSPTKPTSSPSAWHCGRWWL